MKDIHTLSLPQLQQWMKERQQPAFRAKQLYEYLWKQNVTSFQEMLSLPQALRDLLAGEFLLAKAAFADMQESADGSVKYAVRMSDGAVVEMVLIPSRNRSTLCVSSQVGCPLNCRFCATARMGFSRNLNAYEMYAQVFAARQESEARFGHPLSNIVWMGMGEPLLNFEAVKAAVERVTDPEGMGMSPSRITLSTSGHCDGIRQMARELPSVHLAVSLHTADARQRQELMPIGGKYPLSALSDALADYHERTNNRITLEYMLLKDVNDSLRHVRLLLDFCRRFPVKINLIEYNTHPYAPYQPSDADTFRRFAQSLEEKNLIVNVRRSKGRDIAAACGQLANEKKNSGKM
ncbi:MAG: 23S rRNA (adenine(2503)-C(2))-methyltransferase RlmN [Bacteroidales bacterium]|nr:23S rRNA (adenine(2503)-C(2))-methyltransferase RlmN [Bacteroidales bacterium]